MRAIKIKEKIKEILERILVFLFKFLLTPLTGYRLASSYQHFLIHKHKNQIIPLFSTRRKVKSFRGKFEREVRRRSFLDIGCDLGFFCYYARQKGAVKCSGYEIDKEAYNKAIDIYSHSSFDKIDFYNKKMSEINKKSNYDVVLLFSMLHHIYSKTENFGNFDSIFSFLSSLTNHCLFVEFIPYQDPMAIKRVYYRKQIIKEDYNLNNFLCSLKKFFPEVEEIGETHTPGRKLFMCKKKK